MAGTVSWPGLVLTAGLLAACGGPVADTVPLAYEPTGLAPGPLYRRPLIAMRPVVDTRAAAADWLGIATGNLGFPEQALVAEPPASRAVYDAFTTALMARG